MAYAGFGILAVVHHIILNHNVFKNRKNQPKQGYNYRYRQFLNALLVFYVSDLLWGILEELRIRSLIYADTVLFFGTMALSVFLWTRYVAAFLDKDGNRAKSFKAAGVSIFGFGILILIINFFIPVVFTFTEDATYVPGYGRYVLLVVQLLLFLLISVYSIIITHKSKGKERVHYMAISFSGGVMAIFVVLQTFYPFAPFYTIGCLIANTLIHIFVEENEKIEKEQARATFTQIAEGLASNYDVIYYVNLETEDYSGYTANDIYGKLKIDASGTNFFTEAQKNTVVLLHPDDQDRMLTIMDKDYMISALENKKQFDYEYRLIINEQIQHTRLFVRKTSDDKHIVIGVENINDEVLKEREQLRALKTEKELARRDELTGVRNKTAYSEFGQSIQKNIDEGIEDHPFALVVCDLNNLKMINDTKGHKAGDDYIISATKLICDIFDHSPVFRIGGDEFVVYLRDADYDSREELLDKLHNTSITNRDNGNGPVIAAGMAEYNPGKDTDIKMIFDKADKLMYEDKRNLKGER